MKTSDQLENILTKARQVGDTKVGKDGQTRYWTEIKPGKFDWRKTRPQGTKNTSSDKPKSQTKYDKLKTHLKNTSDEKLRKFASGERNDPNLRQFAYDELVGRGEDVSDLDLNTGNYGALKEAFKDDGPDFEPEATGDVELVDDWQDPEFIKKNYGNLKTKQQRIEYDDFAYKQKINNPRYKTPQKEIHSLNKLYAQFLSSKSPLMIASGGAGVGKTYNLHLVAKAMKLNQFDPAQHTAVNPTFAEKIEEGEEDYYDEPNTNYDYVEVPEVKSPLQLVQLLKEHNGKTLVFDDTDNILKDPDSLGIMKKATASSGKRIVGKKSSNEKTNIDPFEFTGKILFLSNMGQHEFTKNEHLNAIYSRALKKDIYFTKQEQLHFIDKLKHKFEFSGIPRLEDQEEDIQEREEVFSLLKDNIESIDPGKFNVRSMKEALEVKRANDNAIQITKDNPVIGEMLFGNTEEDWKEDVVDFLTKGYVPKEQKIQKAMGSITL